jgi:menaquinone-9 beta-reductase
MATMGNPLTGEGFFDAVASGALAGRAALLRAAAGAADGARLDLGPHA